MDDQRIAAYGELIQKLLQCPSGEEPAILQAHSHLLDAGFVQTTLAVAQQAQTEGEANVAGFLTNLATQLAAALGLDQPPLPDEEGSPGNSDPPAAAVSLLQTLLQAELQRLQTQGPPQQIYEVLRQHQAQLNLGLIPVWQRVVRGLVAEYPDEAETTGALLENISIHLSNFPWGDRASNLEITIAGYQLVLEVQTREQNPKGWAQTMNNLATAYSDRIRGDRGENLERAIGAYEQALEVRTRQALPVEWATTMNNLATAYSDRIRGDRGENLERAIGFYGQSLEIFQPQALPEDCLRAGRNLGNLAFWEGWWEVALTGYQPAIAAVEQTRAWATNDARRQEILQDAITVYNNAIQCYINLEQYDQAILLTEQARARHLVELMATNDAYQRGDIPEEVLQYLQQYEELQARIEAERRRQQSSSSGEQKELASVTTKRLPPLAEFNLHQATLAELIKRKEQVWLRLRDADPVLAGSLEVNPFDMASF